LVSAWGILGLCENPHYIKNYNHYERLAEEKFRQRRPKGALNSLVVIKSVIRDKFYSCRNYSSNFLHWHNRENVL